MIRGQIRNNVKLFERSTKYYTRFFLHFLSMRNTGTNLNVQLSPSPNKWYCLTKYNVEYVWFFFCSWNENQLYTMEVRWYNLECTLFSSTEHHQSIHNGHKRMSGARTGKRHRWTMDTRKTHTVYLRWAARPTNTSIVVTDDDDDDGAQSACRSFFENIFSLFSITWVSCNSSLGECEFITKRACLPIPSSGFIFVKMYVYSKAM